MSVTPNLALALTIPDERLERRYERTGLLEMGEPVRFFEITYVGTVGQYVDPDPNLMRGDGMRQRWPPGALEKIRRARVRR
jgi:hypothetical protein